MPLCWPWTKCITVYTYITLYFRNGYLLGKYVKLVRMVVGSSSRRRCNDKTSRFNMGPPQEVPRKSRCQRMAAGLTSEWMRPTTTRLSMDVNQSKQPLQLCVVSQPETSLWYNLWTNIMLLRNQTHSHTNIQQIGGMRWKYVCILMG